VIARAPEQLLVATMGDAVIDIARCCDSTITHARTVLTTARAVVLITAERVQTKEVAAIVLPA
jgi:glycerol dehydrogenase-like iron-containing ADH family enzyme